MAGAHLADYVSANYPGVEIWGSVRKNSNIKLLKSLLKVKFDKLKFQECDFTDSGAVGNLPAAKPFKKVFHFAAQVPIALAIRDPEQTLKTNLFGTLYLLEGIRRNLPETTLILPGSSDEYGFIRPEDNPVKEDCTLRPLNPYGVSKAAQSLLGWQYHKSYGLKIIRTRTFSYTGPGQNPLFACSSFACQIARIDRGENDPVIRVGNLEAFRDYLDIRDIVRAYWLLSESGVPGEVYNVCSGKSVQMQNILDILLKLSPGKIRIERDPERMRPSDIPEARGDNSRLYACTGWKQEINLDRMLADTYNYWKVHV